MDFRNPYNNLGAHVIVTLQWEVETDVQGGGERVRTLRVDHYIDRLVQSSRHVADKWRNGAAVIILDVTPEIFHSAMGFLETQTATNGASPQDLLEVVHFYNQYHFTHGLQLCHTVFRDYLTDMLASPGITAMQDTNTMIQIMLASERIQNGDYSYLVDIGSLILAQKFRDAATNMTPMQITEDQVRMLQPIFVTRLAPAILPSFLGSLPAQDIQSPLFPKYFVNRVAWQRVIHRMEALATIVIPAVATFRIGMLWESGLLLFPFFVGASATAARFLGLRISNVATTIATQLYLRPPQDNATPGWFRFLAIAIKNNQRTT